MTRRRERLNELLRAEISELIRRQVKDPRIGGLITVTEVEVSADLRHAKVFVSVLGTEEEKQETFRGFQAAAGFFRHELGERLSLRYIPEMAFQRDDSIEHGTHILKLIRDLDLPPGQDAPPRGP